MKRITLFPLAALVLVACQDSIPPEVDVPALAPQIGAPEADLRVTKFEESSPVVTGERIDYPILVGNLGPNTAANVVFTDPVPAGLTFVEALPGRFCATCACGITAGVVSCTLGNILPPPQPNAFGFVTFRANEGTVGFIENTAQVSSTTFDPDPTNNQSTEIVEVIAEEFLPSGGLVIFRLSEGAGTVTFTPTTVQNPSTSDRTFAIQFLGDILQLTLGGGAFCARARPCTIELSFNNAQLDAAGIASPSDVVIFHDPEEDGTFDPLVTTLRRRGSGPVPCLIICTVSAEITSTSFVGAGIALDVQPQLDFATFDIEEAEVEQDEFEVEGSFAVAAGSGIDVLNEDVIVTFAGFSHTISAGLFVRDDDDEGFEFDGTLPDGTRLKVEIDDDGEFEVKGRGIPELSGIDLPSLVPFSLRIGDDIGETDIQFDDRGRFRAE